MATTITKTIKSSGGDYTSLSAWEAANQANIVTADQIHVAECYSMLDTAQCVIDGWTTDATRYIEIKTPVSERHDGEWNAAKYRIAASVTYGGVININEEFVRVDGLQIENSGSKADSARAFRLAPPSATSDIRITNCIGRATGTGTATGACAFIYQLNSCTVKAVNNIAYAFGTGFLNSYISGTLTVALYNNTFVDMVVNGIAMEGATSPTYRLANNCVQGGGTNYNLAMDKAA